MQARLQAVKASYHEESVRKAGEVEELGASLEPLLSSNKMMGGLVGQVKEQVARREADMRTQLALLKNCIAFALYVDETLLVDMSDPKWGFTLTPLEPGQRAWALRAPTEADRLEWARRLVIVTLMNT